MHRSLCVAFIVGLTTVGCSRDDRGADNDTALGAALDTGRSGAASVATRDSTFALAECYRSPASVMGRTTPLAGRSSVAPGWLRLAAPPADTGRVASTWPTDSGVAQLIDADGADFQAQWRRSGRDSIRIRGLDDFMEITIRAAVADSTLTGSGLVTSDADVQRDASGRLEPLRREWTLQARAASCDGLPAIAR